MQDTARIGSYRRDAKKLSPAAEREKGTKRRLGIDVFLKSNHYGAEFSSLGESGLLALAHPSDSRLIASSRSSFGNGL
jgi:hypothetical protein